MSTAAQPRPVLTLLDTGEPKYTDLGNSERLIARYGGKLRYVPQRGWMVYDGTRWQVDEAGRVMEFAKDTVTTMRREAADTKDQTRRESLWRHATHSERAERLAAMVSLAKSDPCVRARVEDFDADPMLLNVQNGDHAVNDHINLPVP